MMNPEFVYVSYDEDFSAQTHGVSVALEAGSLVGKPLKYINNDVVEKRIQGLDDEYNALVERHNACVVQIDNWINTCQSLEMTIEQLKTALISIIDRSHNDPLGTSKVVDMRKIAERALGNTGDC